MRKLWLGVCRLGSWRFASTVQDQPRAPGAREGGHQPGLLHLARPLQPAPHRGAPAIRKKRNREVRPAEPPPENLTEDAGGFHAVTDWVMAVLLLGAAGLAVWYFQIGWNFGFDSPKFNPMVFVPIFLGAYGLYHFTLALRGTLLGRKFGSSTMHLEGGDVRMGATIRGVIRTEAELHPSADYEIRLQCIETFVMHRGSGETNRNVDRVRWEAATRVAPAAVNSRQGIPFEFTLPQSFGEPATSRSRLRRRKRSGVDRHPRIAGCLRPQPGPGRRAVDHDDRCAAPGHQLPCLVRRGGQGLHARRWHGDRNRPVARDPGARNPVQVRSEE